MENIKYKTVDSIEAPARIDQIRFMMNNLHEPAILCKWGKNEIITIIEFNQYACKFSGFGPEEMKQKNIYDLFDCDSIRSVRRNINPFPDEGEKTWVAELLTKMRKKIRVEVTTYKFFSGSGFQILLSLRDISEYNETVADLATYKNFFDLIESTHDTGFWEFDLRSEKLWASDGLRKLFGLDKTELTVDDLPELQLGNCLSRLDKVPEGPLENTKLYEQKFDFCRIADNAVISLCSVAVINFYEYKIYGLVQDESEYKKAELKLLEEKKRALDKNRIKQEFISNISNEIYAPMNRIAGYCELLNQPDMTPEFNDNFIEYINNSCSHLHKLITEIVDISRIDADILPLPAGQIYIADLMDETHLMFKLEAHKKNLEFHTDCGNLEKGAFVISDESRLVKVISNLIDNAIHFTHQGYIEFGVMKKGKNLEFYVKDTGVGMSALQSDIITELFCGTDTNQTNYYKRKGLGLAISKYNLDLLGGSLWVESKSGEGSTFHFTIPFTTHIPADEEIVSPEMEAGSENIKTCLLLDSLEVDYFYLRAMLGSSGFRVLWAKDIAEAIYMSINDPVDILLIDMKSTEVNFPDTLKLIRYKRPQILIMAQIEVTSAVNINKTMSEGVDCIISKPVKKKEFLEMAEKTLV